jgi:hypothetical protein
MSFSRENFIGDFPEPEPPSPTLMLPAWFTERMMKDAWSFGLLMITGDVIAIEKINALIPDANGNIWLDATMLSEATVADRLTGSPMQQVNGHPIFTEKITRV